MAPERLTANCGPAGFGRVVAREPDPPAIVRADGLRQSRPLGDAALRRAGGAWPSRF
jgi:hypothetical protein